MTKYQSFTRLYVFTTLFLAPGLEKTVLEADSEQSVNTVTLKRNMSLDRKKQRLET